MTSNLSETPNNQERAAALIYSTLSGQYGDFRLPTDAAQALADARLLMPDLPAPQGSGLADRAAWTTPLGTLTAGQGDGVARLYTDPQQPQKWRTNELREFAHTLLAAANHAEDKQ